MSKPIAIHSDGSNCYTKNCSKRNTPVIDQAINDWDYILFIKQFQLGDKTPEGSIDKANALFDFRAALDKAERGMATDGWPTDYAKSTKKLLIKLYRKYGAPDTGRTRAVFKTGEGEVIKVAFTNEGDVSNRNEVQNSKLEEPFIPSAAARYEKLNNVDVVIMEEVQIVMVRNYNDYPDWVGYVDGAQVGYNKKGELVAYDL